jgi:transcriptional regulator with XRE-family HTH domain
MLAGMRKELTALQAIFGEILREYRTRADLSQEKLALESGLDRTFISLLERGLRQPTLCVLAETLQSRASVMIAEVEERVGGKKRGGRAVR